MTRVTLGSVFRAATAVLATAALTLGCWIWGPTVSVNAKTRSEGPVASLPCGDAIGTYTSPPPGYSIALGEIAVRRRMAEADGRTVGGYDDRTRAGLARNARTLGQIRATAMALESAVAPVVKFPDCGVTAPALLYPPG
jgi:hypothetical protein